MPLQRHQTEIIRLSDRQWIETLQKVVLETPLSVTNFQYSTRITDQPVQIPFAEITDNIILKKIINSEDLFIRNITLIFEPGFTIGLSRLDDKWFDRLDIGPGGDQNPRNLEPFTDFSLLVVGAFRRVSPIRALIDQLGDDAKENYRAREEALNRQERILSSLTSETQSFFHRLSEDFHKKESELDVQYTRRVSELEADFEKRKVALDEREAALITRLKEIDDREYKIARREIYKDFRDKLIKRSQKFELTQSTRNMRHVVFVFTIILLIGFASAAAYFMYHDLTATSTAVSWIVIFRQVTFTLAFVATATFFIRWNHQWFQRHADEEFRILRLDLDMDRANWLVEMAREWKHEESSELPEKLISMLGRNLFADDKNIEADIHPAETIASALFGAAANIKFKTTDGTEVNLDRKSTRILERTDQS